MEATIERLRQSKASFESEMLAAGKKAGQVWATDTAEYEQLKAIVPRINQCIA